MDHRPAWASRRYQGRGRVRVLGRDGVAGGGWCRQSRRRAGPADAIPPWPVADSDWLVVAAVIGATGACAAGQAVAAPGVATLAPRWCEAAGVPDRCPVVGDARVAALPSASLALPGLVQSAAGRPPGRSAPARGDAAAVSPGRAG